MKAVADALEVARSHLHEKVRRLAKRRGSYRKPDDGDLLPLIRRLLPGARFFIVGSNPGPEVQKLFDSQGAVGIASSPEEFGKFLKDEHARFTDIIRNAGISAD